MTRRQISDECLTLFVRKDSGCFADSLDVGDSLVAAELFDFANLTLNLGPAGRVGTGEYPEFLLPLRDPAVECGLPQ